MMPRATKRLKMIAKRVLEWIGMLKGRCWYQSGTEPKSKDSCWKLYDVYMRLSRMIG